MNGWGVSPPRVEVGVVDAENLPGQSGELLVLFKVGGYKDQLRAELFRDEPRRNRVVSISRARRLSLKASAEVVVL